MAQTDMLVPSVRSAFRNRDVHFTAESGLMHSNSQCLATISIAGFSPVVVWAEGLRNVNMLDHFPQRCERWVGNGRALSVAGSAGCAVSDDYFKTCVPTRHGRAASLQQQRRRRGCPAGDVRPSWGRGQYCQASFVGTPAATDRGAALSSRRVGCARRSG